MERLFAKSVAHLNLLHSNIRTSRMKNLNHILIFVLILLSMSFIGHTRELTNSDTTTFANGDSISATTMNQNFNSIITNGVNDNNTNINTLRTDVNSTLGVTIPTTPTFNARVDDLESSKTKRAVVSIDEYPNVFPYYDSNDNPLYTAGTRDSGPGIQAAIQDAIDNHLVLEFPANQLYWIHGTITVYVGADSAVDAQPHQGEQSFDIRGNFSKLWAWNWENFNGPMLRVLSRETLNNINYRSFGGRFENFQLEMNGHYGSGPPHPDMYAIQVGAANNSVWPRHRLFFEGFHISRKIGQSTLYTGAGGATQTIDYNNNAVVVTNSKHIVFRDCSFITGGITFQAVPNPDNSDAGGFVGDLWVDNCDLRGTPTDATTFVNGATPEGPGNETAAITPYRAITIRAEGNDLVFDGASRNPSQVGGLYVTNNQIYGGNVLIRADKNSSLHNVHFTHNEFDWSGDGVPHVKLAVYGGDGTFGASGISDAIHDRGNMHAIRFVENTFTVPKNAPVFVIEDLPPASSSGSAIGGTDAEIYDVGFINNRADGGIVTTGTAQPAAFLQMDGSVNNIIIDGNVVNRYAGDGSWTSMVSVDNAKGKINFNNNQWDDSVENWIPGQVYSYTGDNAASQKPTNAINFTGTTENTLTMTATGNVFPDGVNLVGGNQNGRIIVGTNTASAVKNIDLNSLSTIPPNEPRLARPYAPNVTIGALNVVTNTTNPSNGVGWDIETFHVDDDTTPNRPAPPAGSKFSIKVDDPNGLEILDTSNRSTYPTSTNRSEYGRIHTLSGSPKIFPQGSIIEFISDGTDVWELPGTSTSVRDLSDVSSAIPAAGNTLVYDAVAQEYQPGNPGSGIELGDLSNVITDPAITQVALAIGRVLKWNGARWEPGLDNETSGTTNLSDLPDVFIEAGAINPEEVASGDLLRINTDTPSGEPQYISTKTNTYRKMMSVSIDPWPTASNVIDVLISQAGVNEDLIIVFEDIIFTERVNAIGIQVINGAAGTTYINEGYHFRTESDRGGGVPSANHGGVNAIPYFRGDNSGNSTIGIKRLEMRVTQATENSGMFIDMEGQFIYNPGGGTDTYTSYVKGWLSLDDLDPSGNNNIKQIKIIPSQTNGTPVTENASNIIPAGWRLSTYRELTP